MNCKLFLPLLLFCVVHTSAVDLQAQAGESSPPAPIDNSSAGSGDGDQTKTPPPAKIVGAWCVNQEEGQDDSKASKCFLNNSLVLEVENLESWTKRTEPELNPDQLLLVLNGVVLKGPLFGTRYDDPTGSGHTLLRFDLDRSRETSSQEWKELMGGVKADVAVQMSVGLAPATEPKGNTVGPQRLFRTGTVSIQATSSTWFWVAVLSYIVLVLVLVKLANSSYILRGPPSPDGRRPFSLGRVQMAWWFLIVVGSYLHIFIVLGDYNTLTAGVLILIGISAATGFAGATIDTSRRVLAGEQSEEKKMLEKEQQTLTAEMGELDAKILATQPPVNLAQLQAKRTSQQQRLDQVTARLAKLAAALPAPAAAAPQTASLMDIFGTEAVFPSTVSRFSSGRPSWDLSS